MSSNLNLLLVGAGYMATEYSKVLVDLGYEFRVVGRSEKGVKAFLNSTGIEAYSGGIEKYYLHGGKLTETAIVAVSESELAKTSIFLIEHGVKRILLEKPGAENIDDLKKICKSAEENKASVQIAYNRRYYSSVDKALEIIENDGGVKSFMFEFTEWLNVIKERNPSTNFSTLFLANSTHVADLAFFLGGFPKKMTCYRTGSLLEHPSGSIFSGSGMSERGAVFSYSANWNSPGRWGVEIMTDSHRLIFRPLEKLSIQNQNSVIIENVDIDDELDNKYKPGLYKQVKAFCEDDKNDNRRLFIEEHLMHFPHYIDISGEDY